ncbi:hypothetical protein B0J13DRAFT_611790 [Dactylonectria estremocensis]|uniref:Insecticide toxin TcdB middle/N-terminal domain-containing protein n=1 Tax=Dactylonectria estremocensis TaxID=1079267 RepID=A0A9P9DTP8_9HYPO|nr:hypothetical protein B0J13DRAFT_611790 [Dactylonectria estremocensis]
MDNYLAAIGREFGKVDTDSGGLSRYSLKIQTPPGIGHGNEPELSLEYSQGFPNGSLGLGWALGGLSCIRKAPSSLAYDGKNTPPADYNRFQPKLTLDGAELLNTKGIYGAQDAEYTTEVESLDRTVSHVGPGFLVRDSTGVRKEYGTTEDSRVLASDGIEVREWRLKRHMDRHGNSVIYTYVASAQGLGSRADVHTCYLSEVRYCSNEETGHPAARIVQLEYSSRDDVVVQTIQGTKSVWASILSAIRIGVIREGNVGIDRSYELNYTKSQFTGDSCLTSVTETSGSGDNKVELLPSTFGYTSPNVSPQDLFKTGSQKVTPLRQTTNNVAIFTLNISGRSLADVACVRYNPGTKSMSIKTYLAARGTNGTINWTASDGPGAEATLPAIDVSRGFPNILCPDSSGDGRSDLIIPYCDSDNMVRFSLSQSIGTGFQNYRTKSTPFRWTDGSKFMAVDLRGRGSVDVVQIFTDRKKLAFRNFSSATTNGQLELENAKPTFTDFENVGTIDWFLLTHAKTGATSLVRVWIKDQGKGMSSIMATAFAAASSSDSSTGFDQGTTCTLESSVRNNQVKYNVVACDINGDGTQDIVLATAEYQNGRMFLGYTTFLGDGHGGFEKHDNTVKRDLVAPAPLNSENYGQFHTTNLNGSNYPSVSYVYQERNSKSYVCLSVDGRCSGLVSEVILYRIAGDMPSSKMEVVPTDLNGNGTGDWLFHTVENDQPRLVPVYNCSDVTDFLSWARDSMGFRTDVTYGALSDPDVYTSSESWKNYENKSKDSYAVLGAPNYVVTGLTHSNDRSINSFAYNVSIKKTYSSAIVNTKGRGWQGFEKIHSLNTTDQVLTTETYFQEWPLTSQKRQVDTQTADGKVLKSEKTAFEAVSISKGPWKTYHANKTLEQTEMLEGGVVVRSNATLYTYDVDGNVTSQSSSETVRGQLKFQSWQKCTYTTISGIKGLLTSKKISSKPQNINMLAFEEGDGSLSLFAYNSPKPTLKTSSEWSTDVGSFAVKTFTYDGHGNETQTVDAAGLKTTTTYDDRFKSFPVKVMAEGPGISTVHLAAFDEASGQETAKLEGDGSLTCYRLDQFGRIIEARMRSSGQGGSVVTATDFFINRPYVTDTNFSTILASCNLDPYREMKFERQKDASGLAYIGMKVLSYSKEGVDGRCELFELMNCAKQVQKRYSRHGDDAEKTWMFWEYDSFGHHIFETFPTKAPASSGLDWAPDRSGGITATFDTLGRPTVHVRPAHADGGHFIVASKTYLDGGTRIQERVLSAPSAKTPLANATELALVEKVYVRINQEDRITEIIDENKLRSTFQYDVSGNMVLATDPAGNQERRTYNSSGYLVTMNNPYQNIGSAATSATSYQYNIANHLVSQVNATGEVVTYKRDAKGRPLQKMGKDGRVVVYAYDAEGIDKPSSIAVYPQGSSSPLESRFDITYDHQGRVKDRNLTIADGTCFTTSMSYNWQGEAVRKEFPDGAITTNEYRGALIRSSTLSSGSASTWLLKADVEQYNAAESPEKIVVQGTAMKANFEHGWKYDAQGFPLSHSLRAGNSSLVQDHYMYNDTDQMVRRHEFLTGTTTDYSYIGRRLESSRSGDGVKNSYAYDQAGNLTQKRGVNIAHSPGRAVGTRDNAPVFDVSYDASGRMVKRTTNRSAFNFAYDSFGWLKSYSDEGNGVSVEIMTDFEGETLHRKNTDGSSDLLVSDDFSIHTRPDGSRIVRHKLFSKEYMLGTITNTYESANSTRPLGGGHRAVSIPFTDTKRNVTHIYNGEDAALREKLDYDEYGSLESDSPVTEKDRTSTYEGTRLDEATGLLDFGGRWYDPLVGRFTTPDDIVDLDLLIRTDGLNRYAFENNDPINHIDPTGHWSWFSVLGVVIGAAMVIGAVAITVATGGAAGVLAAAIVGGLASGGIAGITYSIDHHDEKDFGTFAGGFVTTLAINAAIGAATGALGAVATPARALSGTSRLFSKVGLASIVAKAALGGTASVLTKAAERGVSNAFYGTDDDLFAGAGATFGMGAFIGAAGGAWGLKGQKPPSPNKLPGINKFSGSFKLRSFTGIRSVLAPQPTNPWAKPGITQSIWDFTKISAGKTGKLSAYGYKNSGLEADVNSALKKFRNGF